MNYSIGRMAGVMAGVCLLAMGCAPNRAYRTSFLPYNKTAEEAGLDKNNKAVVETTPDYSLGFVEFDEEGWFWNTNQVKAVKKMIRTEAHTGETNNAAGIIMVVFVHGWKNNAAYNCGNVNLFRTALQQLDEAEKMQSGDTRPARRVVGIYCGWRGLAATWEPFKELSIWNRKGTAHKVGGSGAMTEFFVQLEALQELSNGTIRTNGPRTELIIVGHSFGGAAVYSAISQFVTERFVDNLEKGKPLKPLGDQVILLNPAFEASRHFNLNRMATSIEKYPEEQRPVLSIFTSRGDWATHYFMPLGQFFPTMLEKFRSGAQRDATREAVGWYPPFITHSLVYNTNSVLGESPTNTTYNLRTKKHELQHGEKLRESVQNVQEQKKKWRSNSGDPRTYYFDDCVLKPRASFRPGDPFLVVAVDPKIMKDHGDIDNPVLINFLREYIQFCHRGATVKAGDRKIEK